MTEQLLDDGAIEKALTDYQEGMRLKDRHRAADGMRKLQILDGVNLELFIRMLRRDASLSRFYLYYLRFDQSQRASQCGSVPLTVNETMFAAIAAGSEEATADALAKIGKLEGDNLELLAMMMEAQEPLGAPFVMSFIQRQTGPPVDPLAIKARWLSIYWAFRKIPEYKEIGEKKLRKELIGEALDAFGGTMDVSRSLLYDILKYFKYPKT